MKRVMVAVVLLALMAALVGPSAALAEPPDPAYAPDQVVIQYHEGTTAADHGTARGRVRAVPQTVVRTQGNGAASLEVVRLPQGASVQTAIAVLQADPAVRFAEPNWRYSYAPTLYANDPTYVEDHHWGVYGDVRFPADGCVGTCVNRYGSQANAAWNDGKTGDRRVYVGVIDTGIQDTHEDLVGNIWTNPLEMPGDGIDNDSNGYVDDIHGWNFAADTNQTYVATDDENHGTHVSGTIGALGGNGKGVAGVNWQASIISGKFFGNGPGNGSLDSAVKAVDYFVTLKTRQGLNLVAINASWGCACNSQALYEAIGRANQANILFVAAAGNSTVNNDGGRAFYPASYDLANVISVAAIDEYGSLASFSNYGARSVDLGAPGVGIASTVQGNGYAYYSGTSMAAPHVVGAAALYAATKLDSSGKVTDTAAQIKGAIMQTAYPTAALKRKTVSNGRLNISCLLATTTCQQTGP